MSADILEKFLEQLRDRQSWCPSCGGECVCNSACLLNGLWFKKAEAMTLTCQDCQSASADVTDTICPYASEINGTKLAITVCSDCYHQRAWDV